MTCRCKNINVTSALVCIVLLTALEAPEGERRLDHDSGWNLNNIHGLNLVRRGRSLLAKGERHQPCT
jgi:hypothetical protein